MENSKKIKAQEIPTIDNKRIHSLIIPRSITLPSQKKQGSNET
jgi:hypothetical protein